MRPPFRLRFPLSAVLLAILAAAQLSCSTAPSLRRVPGSDISGIANGNPENQGGALGPSTYAEFDARNLNEAKVLWLNFDLLHEWGIDVPEGGLTPEFERELIEELAYMVPQADDPPHLFNDRMKKFFADRYGGAGMAGNYGSGRAGAAGKVQVKGIGVTPLKPEGVGFHHGHGGASIEESLREAIFGEINHRELPFGANRVLAIIDTKTYTRHHDGGMEPRALIVRENPVRPSHFIANRALREDLPEIERARMQEQALRFADAAPQPPGTRAATRWELIRSGTNEVVRRMAEQYGAAYGLGLYHGATSPGNIELSGRFLDYGTQTAQPGFGPIQVVDWVDPFGTESKEIKELILQPLYRDLRKFLPLDLKSAVPSDAELLALFDKEYAIARRKHLLYQTGVPMEVLTKIISENASIRLYEVFQEVIGSGAKHPVVIENHMPDRIGNYDAREIMLKLAHAEEQSVAGLSDAITGHMPDSGLRGEIAKRYYDFMESVRSAAEREGINRNNLRAYQFESAQLRNRKVPELYRKYMQDENKWLIEIFKNSGNRSDLWDSVNRRVTFGSRSRPPIEAGELVLSQADDKTRGVYLQRVYNPYDGQYRIRIRARASRHEPVQVSWENGGNFQDIHGHAKGRWVEYMVPMNGRDETPRIRLKGNSLTVPALGAMNCSPEKSSAGCSGTERSTASVIQGPSTTPHAC